MLIRYAYNSYRISMSYDVYRVKNVQKKIADFEHPTRKGFICGNSKIIIHEHLWLIDGYL